MKTIRQNVFETNSSSSHSVTISDYGKNLKFDLGEEFICEGGEFGWEWKTYDYWMDRLRYAYATLRSAKWNVEYEKDEDGFILPTTPELQMLDKVLKDQLSVTTVHYKDDAGYVDHQSVSESFSDIFHDEESLKTFIFNDGSEFRTGNDND